MVAPVLYEHDLTGHPNAVIGSLCRSIGQYARRYELLYVGRTRDRWRRFGEHKRNWKKAGNTLYEMISVYKTKSFANMVKVEAEAIEHVKAEARRYQTAEVLNSRYGDWEESLVFYLYMLTDDGADKQSVSTKVDWDQMLHAGLATKNMDRIKKKIREIGDDAIHVYVGFTDDPDVRFAQHQQVWSVKKSWSTMVVLFEGRNLHDTFAAENVIIRYALKRFGDDKCYNASLKYDLDASEDYHVYVALGHRGLAT